MKKNIVDTFCEWAGYPGIANKVNTICTNVDNKNSYGINVDVLTDGDRIKKNSRVTAIKGGCFMLATSWRYDGKKYIECCEYTTGGEAYIIAALAYEMDRKHSAHEFYASHPEYGEKFIFFM